MKTESMNTIHTRGLVAVMIWAGVSCAGEQASPDREAMGANAAGVSNQRDGAGSFADHSAATEPIGACHWPSRLAAVGSTTREVCSAARAFLSCDVSGGSVACPSDDLRNCVNAAEVESPMKNCTSHCEVDEYAAFCGGVGPGRVPEPPAGCRFKFANPAGVAVYCCPCE